MIEHFTGASRLLFPPSTSFVIQLDIDLLLDNIFWITLHRGLSRVVLKFFLYQDPMGNGIICCRQVNECGSDNHAILVAILNVLSEGALIY